MAASRKAADGSAGTGGKLSAEEEAEFQVKMWKMKKLIKTLRAARGAGTSMISLIVPPGDQVSRVSKMLTDESSAASNIKSRVNRLSVLSAITSVLQRLKLYQRIPKNGLIVFCGTILTDEGKEKKISLDFEPFKKINTSLYLCDSVFHTEALESLLESTERFAVVVVDGNGALFAALSGNTRTILHKVSVDLPKKHGRGGQSALRFARLRLEKRANWVRKVAELASQLFITNDKPNISGIVLAGSADFKNRLASSDLFDKRLRPLVLKLVDVSYGGENGLQQAIELSADTLANVKFVREKRLLTDYMSAVARDGNYAFGVRDTLTALSEGAAETLIVWEELPTTRFKLRNPTTNEESIVHMDEKEQKSSKAFTDPETGVELDVVEKQPLVEWLAETYKDHGATLEMVSDKSQEGSQFCKGFGGIGAMLRYAVNFEELHDDGSAARAAAKASGDDDDDDEDNLQKEIDDFDDDAFI